MSGTRLKRMNSGKNMVSQNWAIVILSTVGLLAILGVLVATPDETTAGRLTIIAAIVAFVGPTIAGLFAADKAQQASNKAEEVSVKLDVAHEENTRKLEHIQEVVNHGNGK